MTTFARIDNNTVCDPQINATEAEYRARNPLFGSWPTVSQVPDGTLHGAKSDGAGGWVNPAPPNIPPLPAILSASGFQDVCETGLGGGTTGAARFGAITRAMAASADDLVFSLNQRFVKATIFDKTKSAALFSVLVSKGLMTAGERTAILAAWS